MNPISEKDRPIPNLCNCGRNVLYPQH